MDNSKVKPESIKNPQTALNTKTEKPKSFDTKIKPQNRSKKYSKPKIPMPPSVNYVWTDIEISISEDYSQTRLIIVVAWKFSS